MRRFLLLVAVGMLCCQPAFAAEIGIKYDSKSGDKELDLQLGKLNREANVDRKKFIKNLSVSFGVDEKRIEIMLDRDKMEPADAYMAVNLKKMTNQPLDHIVEAFKKNRGKGWGVIAIKLGIKPGSSEFHELKRASMGKAEMMPESKGRGQEKSKGQGKGKKKNR